MRVKIGLLIFLCLAWCFAAGDIGSLGVSQVQAGEMEPGQKPVRLAQLQLQFGVSEKDIVRSLSREGYSEIRVTESGFSSIRGQACYKGGRYSFKVKRFTGEISRGAKIGECRPVVSDGQVIRKLKRQNYSRISIYSDRGDVFRLTACKRRDRYRITVNAYGDVVQETKVGRCIEEYSVAEVRQRLRDDGYNRVEFVRERERAYVFEACRRGQRVRVRVRRNGKIGTTRRLGRKCSPPINAARLPVLMERKGYDRVAIVDDKLPLFVAEGCKGLKLVQVKFNRFGEVMNEGPVGECDPPLTKADVVDLLRKKGARRIQVDVDRNDNFVASSCFRGNLHRSRFNKYGKLFEQKRVGKCPPTARLGDVIDKLEDRRLDDVHIFIEGCRGDRRVRIEIDEYGETLGRSRVGNCR